MHLCLEATVGDVPAVGGLVREVGRQAREELQEELHVGHPRVVHIHLIPHHFLFPVRGLAPVLALPCPRRPCHRRCRRWGVAPGCLPP